MNFRPATIHDLPELQQLFVGTIKTVCAADYTTEQTEVWASGIENNERWQQVLLDQIVWVATNEEKITGFCTLANGSYIDLFYVHKDHQRQGIAFQLYTRIEQEAKRRNQTELTSNVSKTAKKFFEKMGFEVVTEQTVTIKGVDLTNYKMKKYYNSYSFTYENRKTKDACGRTVRSARPRAFQRKD